MVSYSTTGGLISSPLCILPAGISPRQAAGDSKWSKDELAQFEGIQEFNQKVYFPSGTSHGGQFQVYLHGPYVEPDTEVNINQV